MMQQDRKGRNLTFPLDNSCRKFIYYDSLTDLLMALEAGMIDAIQADEPTVQYIMSLDDTYAEHHPVREGLFIDYSMLFLEEDTELRDLFNEAITAMREDGTLDALAEKYIDGVIAGEDSGAVEFPEFDGAETITVAVTGDVPPMDFVDDEGYDAGFNTAVLAEIANRLELNMEGIQVSTGARALALASGRADAVFWVQSFTGEHSDEGLDIPEGTINSEPYYTTVRCSLVLGGE